MRRVARTLTVFDSRRDALRFRFVAGQGLPKRALELCDGGFDQSAAGARRADLDGRHIRHHLGEITGRKPRGVEKHEIVIGSGDHALGDMREKRGIGSEISSSLLRSVARPSLNRLSRPKPGFNADASSSVGVECFA